MSDDSRLSEAEAPKASVYHSSSLEIPTSHAGFKPFVLDHIKRSGPIYYAMDFHRLTSRDTPVMVYKGKTYSLRISTGAPAHQLPDEEENDLETCFRQIRYESEGGQKFYVSLGTKQPDSFLPLGYLVGPDEDNKAGRATNFVWALNITRDPVSLWLIYDYVLQDDLGLDWIGGLPQVYNNIQNAREHRCTHTRHLTHRSLASRPPGICLRCSTILTIGTRKILVLFHFPTHTHFRQNTSDHLSKPSH
ncbi:MAG: hypothetical protein Q9166_000129 [cf. Caloplaca sp. 2 TL-2023]